MPEAWLRDGGPTFSCLCQGMRQWCERGMHQRCVCPHRSGYAALAWLQRRDGSFVPDRSTGGWWCLWIVPKPCQLHQRCPCSCHQPVVAKPAATTQEPMTQEPLFALRGATQ